MRLKTGWELVQERARQIGEIERVTVQIGDDVRIVRIQDLRSWLERMVFFDPDRGDDWRGFPSPADHEYAFCLWTAERLWYVDKNEGYAQLMSMPRTPEVWVEVRRTQR